MSFLPIASYIYTRPIGILIWVFAIVLRDLGSIPDWVIPMTQKMVLDGSLFNTRHNKVQIKGKWSNPGKGVVSSLTPWCSSYWKRSFWVTFDYSWPTYLYISSSSSSCDDSTEFLDSLSPTIPIIQHFWQLF